MPHSSARPAPAGTLILVHRIQSGRAVAHVAAEMGISRTTAWRWCRRVQVQGPGGIDRSVQRGPITPVTDRVLCGDAGADHASPNSPWPRVHRQQAGHACLNGGPCAAPPPHSAAARAGPPGDRDGDPRHRRSAQRYEQDHPGALIHIEVKKLGRIPDGGGRRAHGRSEKVRGRGIGYDYVHTAIDDHSRVAYAETHNDERARPRPDSWNAQSRIRPAWRHARTRDQRQRVRLPPLRGIPQRHRRARHHAEVHQPPVPGRREGGAAEPHTVTAECAHARAWTSNTDRAAALPA